MLTLVSCNLPIQVTGILSQVYKTIIILIPVGIVLFGTIDFIKATAAKDDKLIASSGKTFISRLIAGCLTFFVLSIVNWLFTTIIGNVGNASSAMDCALEILGGNASNYSNGSDLVNKAACYGIQYGYCMASNKSSNRAEECDKSATKLCETNNTNSSSNTTTTSNISDDYDLDGGGENRNTTSTESGSTGGHNQGGGGSGGRR